MSISLADSAVRLRVGLSIRDADPLEWWRFGLQGDALERVREAFRLFTAPDPIDELHLRACNKGTKTETKAAFVVACLQKREELDGVPIPQWYGPVEGSQFVLDYPQQLLSVKPAYLRLLGGWPHHATHNGDYLKSLHVMPVGGDRDDQSGWSVLYFWSQKNYEIGTGARGDVFDFDEPPRMDILDEMRKAAHSGRRSITLIGETPTKMKQWAPLRKDYGDTPRSCLRRVDQERAEVRWSLHEVADWVLSLEEKDALKRKYRRSAIADARLHGDYTNAEGDCPFGEEGAETLLTLFEHCREPEIRTVAAVREGVNGEPHTMVKVPVEFFRPPLPGRKYYFPVDPASGKESGNPLAFLGGEFGTADLCVRWNGRIPPFTLGVLLAAVARQYNEALVDIEMKDHWGINVYRGLQHAKYNNIGHETRELGRPGEMSKEAGWDMDAAARETIIGCVQEWLAARAAGIVYGDCPSRDVLQCLMDMETDERGKIVAGPGIAHAEDAVLWGRLLQKAASRSSRTIPAVMKVPKTPDQRIAAIIRGDKRANGNGRPFMRPKVRIR